MQPTVIFDSTSSVPRQNEPTVSRGNVGFIAGARPQFSEETATLVRSRLSAAALAIAVVLAAAFIGNLVSESDTMAIGRFEKEVKATAKLTHWNTIEIYDYGRTDDGMFYYVTELLPGMSLEDLVEQCGPLPPERVVYLLGQICGALKEAHSVGLIHRDIKPANIFASQRGGTFDVAKLLDFGLVKEGGDKPDTGARYGAFSGTPLYMSPEQASAYTEVDRIAFLQLPQQPPGRIHRKATGWMDGAKAFFWIAEFR